MKKAFLLFGLATVFALSGCKKNKVGNVIFWQRSGSGYGITVVSIDGISSNITEEFAASPSCGTAGCATFNNLEMGNYDYVASDGSSNWSGKVSVSKQGCTVMELY
jgi:hypothetical protein